MDWGQVSSSLLAVPFSIVPSFITSMVNVVDCIITKIWFDFTWDCNRSKCVAWCTSSVVNGVLAWSDLCQYVFVAGLNLSIWVLIVNFTIHWLGGVFHRSVFFVLVIIIEELVDFFSSELRVTILDDMVHFFYRHCVMLRLSGLSWLDFIVLNSDSVGSCSAECCGKECFADHSLV